MALFCAVVASCHARPPSPTPHAARTLRPVGDLLLLRMTPITTTTVAASQSVRPVPSSHVAWRVRSAVVETVGPAAHLIEVTVDGQDATLRGSVPTGWQADEIEARLAEIDVLRRAAIAWRVVDRNAARPIPHDAGASEPE